MAKYFPFYANIENRPVLIVGCGEKAIRKAEKLLPFAPQLCIWADSFPDEIKGEASIRLFNASETDFSDLLSSVAPIAVIITERGDPRTPRLVEYCRSAGVPVNVEDSAKQSDFIFPSIINRGDLTVSVSTSGAVPAVAVKLRREIESALPDCIDQIINWMKALRAQIRSRGELDSAESALFFKLIADEAFEKERVLTDAEVDAFLCRVKMK